MSGVELGAADAFPLLRGALRSQVGKGDPEHQVGEAAGELGGGAVEDLAVEQLVDAPGDRDRGDSRQFDATRTEAGST